MTHFFKDTRLKGNKIIIRIVLVIMLISMLTRLSPGIALQDFILCPLSQNTVTIDGRWTNEDEWIDAFEHDMTFYEGSGNCYFKVKHDNVMLYILIDFVTDVSLTLKDEAIISIDSDHDSAPFPQKDDFRWSISFWNDPDKPGSSYVTGIGEKEWSKDWASTPPYMVGNASMSSENNLYSSEPHRIYEFSIPLNRLNRKAIGIFFLVIDTYETNATAKAIWPPSEYDNPSQWVELTFSNRLLHQIEELASLTYPTEDVQLEYRNEIEYILPQERSILMSEIYTFHPINVSDSLLELDLQFESTIQSPQYTSIIEITYYSLNDTILNIEKTKDLTTKFDFENIYVMDENISARVKDIREDGVFITRIYWKIYGAEHRWFILPIAWWSENHGNFNWWSEILQPGKYIEILDLDKLELKEGTLYNFQDHNFQTITTERQSENELWTITEKWIWDKTTGILLEYTSEGKSIKGTRFNEHCTLREVKKKDTKLMLQTLPLRPTKHQTSTILGSLSLTGNTTIHLTIMDPLGVKKEEEVTTDPFGEFKTNLIPHQEGEWRVQARWDGSILHNSATTELNIQVQQVNETTQTTYSTIPQQTSTDRIDKPEIVVLILGIIIIAIIFFILKRTRALYPHRLPSILFLRLELPSQPCIS